MARGPERVRTLSIEWRGQGEIHSADASPPDVLGVCAAAKPLPNREENQSASEQGNENAEERTPEPPDGQPEEDYEYPNDYQPSGCRVLLDLRRTARSARRESRTNLRSAVWALQEQVS